MTLRRRLFLVAGSAGSGKSTLAKALAHEFDAGWLQLDSIWLAMKVAASLFMSEATVKAHVSRLFNKLGVASRVQIAIVVHDADQS